VSGDTLVAGAYGDDTAAGGSAGSAYVFVRSGATWSLQQKLEASDGATFEWFGVTAALEGDTLAIGASLDQTPSGGSVYLFTRSGTTWSEQQRLEASDGTTLGQFGLSLALSGDTLAVGAPSASFPGASGRGAAYVFMRSGGTWSLQQDLAASDGGASHAFGRVALSAGELVVGAATGNSPAAGGTGAAYVFELSGNTWSQAQKLLAADGWNDQFGSSVAVSADTALIGAPFDQTIAGDMAGSVYVFVRSGGTWTLQQRLMPSDGSPNAEFGQAVALQGDTAVVGAPGEDTSHGVNVGSAYVFVRSGATWTQQQKLLPPSPQGLEQFGGSVALSGDTAIVGQAKEVGGAAHVFVRAGGTWTLQQTLEPFFAGYFGVAVALSGDTPTTARPTSTR
jgi:hypothetical protein